MINIHVKILDFVLTFNLGFSAASGIGTFPLQQQQFNMNQNIVSPPWEHAKNWFVLTRLEFSDSINVYSKNGAAVRNVQCGDYF